LRETAPDILDSARGKAQHSGMIGESGATTPVHVKTQCQEEFVPLFSR
jgi:hypothetical protein